MKERENIATSNAKVSFSHAYLKIDRANKHVNDIEAAILSLKGHYVSRVEEHGQVSIRYECPDFGRHLSEIALVTGDAVHNLRTALDYAWVSVIESLKLPVRKWTKFPFMDTEDELRNALAERKVGGPGSPLFERIVKEVKPYRGGNPSLCALHEADIADKHKLILPVIDRAAVHGITVEDEHGQAISGDTWDLRGTDGFFHLDFAATVKIRNQGHLSLAVHFDEGSALAGPSIPKKLIALSDQVRDIVRSLEDLG
jgi:hypothetical protein